MKTGIILLWFSLGAGVVAGAQSTSVPPDLDKNGRTLTPRPQPHLMYSPADLVHNAVTLPVSGTTVGSAIVNMSAVTKATLYVNCSQAVDVLVNTYQEDGITIDGTYPLRQGLRAGGPAKFIPPRTAPKTNPGHPRQNHRRPQTPFWL